MVTFETVLENKIFPLFVLENLLAPVGFVFEISEDQPLFHLKLDDAVIIIPFYAVAGSLDFPGITVRLENLL